MHFLSHLKVGPRLGAGFALLLLLMLGMLVVSLGQLSRQQSSLVSISGEFRERIAQIGLMRDSVRFQSIALRDVVDQEDISFKKNELKQMREARKRYKEASEVLAAFMSDPAAQGRMEEIRKQEELVAEAVSQVMEFTLTDQHAEAREGVRELVRPRQIALVEALEALQKEIEAQGLLSVDKATASYQTSRNILLALGLIALVLGALVAWLITRSIVSPLLRTVDFASRIASGDLTARMQTQGNDELARLQCSLDDMAEHLADLIREVTQAGEASFAATAALARAAEEGVSQAGHTAQRIQEVAIAMNQMTHSTERVSRGANMVTEAAALTQQVAFNGNQNMAQGEKAIASVVADMTSYAETIRGLNGRIQEISAITSVIREIADQTNLLALNAAIEAARAGDAGRGFAVVADEVRKLAEKTTSSTESISHKVEAIREQATRVVDAIQNINGAVEHSASLSAQTSNILGEILVAADKMVSESEQIAIAARDQNEARQSTDSAVDQITTLASREASAMQSIEGISSELRRSTERLHELIARFRV